MASHAENIRARLNEITTTLGLDLPVYLLVTKADLLAGFREYFARNTDAESDQVFGTTAPGAGTGTGGTGTNTAHAATTDPGTTGTGTATQAAAPGTDPAHAAPAEEHAQAA